MEIVDGRAYVLNDNGGRRGKPTTVTITTVHPGLRHPIRGQCLRTGKKFSWTYDGYYYERHQPTIYDIIEPLGL